MCILVVFILFVLYIHLKFRPYWITTKSNLIFVAVRLADFEEKSRKKDIPFKTTSHHQIIRFFLFSPISLSKCQKLLKRKRKQQKKRESNSSFIEVLHKIDARFIACISLFLCLRLSVRVFEWAFHFHTNFSCYKWWYQNKQMKRNNPKMPFSVHSPILTENGTLNYDNHDRLSQFAPSFRLIIFSS